MIKDFIRKKKHIRYVNRYLNDLDEAIIGFEPNLWKVVYSRSLVVDVLMKRDGMGPDEAVEYAEFNIFGAMVGEKTPLWVENYNW